MKRLFWTLLLIFLAVSCSSNSEDITDEPTQKEPIPSTKDRITFKVISNGKDGYGYQIFRGSKMLINQQHVPAVNGLYGFETEEKAELAAKFIIERMKEGSDRPSVDASDLDSIGAINLDSLINYQEPQKP